MFYRIQLQVRYPQVSKGNTQNRKSDVSNTSTNVGLKEKTSPILERKMRDTVMVSSTTRELCPGQSDPTETFLWKRRSLGLKKRNEIPNCYTPQSHDRSHDA